MLKRILRALLKGKRWLVTIPTVLALGFLGFTSAKFRLVDYGRSYGSRSGVLRKVSRKRSQKGMPFCTYTSVEMILPSVQQGMVSDTWHFTVEDDRPDSPIIKRLQDAERKGERITVNYRQDLNRWWSCPETEYYATSVD